MSEMSDVLSRFHRTLVDEIRTRRPDYLDGPFTVAEIYQNLVPYRTHRERIGVDMNGDYEDALLRLLAGEGGYLVLESDPALRALRDELGTQNPNTGLYREFAAVDVRLNASRMEGGVPDGIPLPEPDTEVSAEGPEPPGVEAVPEDFPPDESEAPAASIASEDMVRPVPDTCPWCRGELPARANLNFCPFCGTDVHVVPCPACGEELDPEWRFCIACGAEVGS